MRRLQNNCSGGDLRDEGGSHKGVVGGGAEGGGGGG